VSLAVAGAPRAPARTTALPRGAGIGLRSAHHEALLEGRPDCGWIEVHTENYFHEGGPAVRVLERARSSYPLSLHGVGLGLGSVAELDREHLERVRTAVRRFEPALVSEHACWCHVENRHFNDLLPLPQTEEAVEHLARRIVEVQDFLGRAILIENLSAYVRYADSQLGEGEFLAAVVERSGCGLLLDVNNAIVNAHNLGLDPHAFLAELPRAAVQEIHLAGHSVRRVGDAELLIDDHGSAVPESVWQLYGAALERFGPVPTLIEWDNDIPALEVLLAEARRADDMLGRAGDR
jgi:uncharacterized protein (UPF0276 family)